LPNAHPRDHCHRDHSSRRLKPPGGLVATPVFSHALPSSDIIVSESQQNFSEPTRKLEPAGLPLYDTQCPCRDTQCPGLYWAVLASAPGVPPPWRRTQSARPVHGDDELVHSADVCFVRVDCVALDGKPTRTHCWKARVGGPRHSRARAGSVFDHGFAASPVDGLQQRSDRGSSPWAAMPRVSARRTPWAHAPTRAGETPERRSRSSVPPVEEIAGCGVVLAQDTSHAEVLTLDPTSDQRGRHGPRRDSLPARGPLLRPTQAPPTCGSICSAVSNTTRPAA